MKQSTARNRAAVRELMERCKSLMTDAIKEAVDVNSIASMDGDTFGLLKQTMALFEDACNLSIDLAGQLDEQTDMLNQMAYELEIMRGQNDSILKILEKDSKKKDKE